MYELIQTKPAGQFLFTHRFRERVKSFLVLPSLAPQKYNLHICKGKQKEVKRKEES